VSIKNKKTCNSCRLTVHGSRLVALISSLFSNLEAWNREPLTVNGYKNFDIIICNRSNAPVEYVNLMKHYIAVMVTLIFFICPSICFSSYLIELNNGSAFIINHYWKEGGQIKFYYYGGVVGIKKEFVRKIRESDLPYIVEEPQPAKKEKSRAEAEYKPESKQKKEARLLPPPEKKAFLEEKMRIATEIEAVSAAYKKAKVKKDRNEQDKHWKKLLLLHKKRSALRDQAKTAHGGQVPSWWWD